MSEANPNEFCTTLLGFAALTPTYNWIVAMNTAAVLVNEFVVRYDERGECVCIHTIHAGKEDPAIRIRLATLKEMKSDEASKWVGETILLLIPTLRREVFGILPSPNL